MIAQKEANIWYFGDYAGLNFNSGEPVVLTNGQTNTSEGCSVLSDYDGNLLMYTDGVTVWNRNHQVMDNGSGLLGNSSSSQSSVIIPVPGATLRYYIFTIDFENGSNGLNYSIADLSQNNGSGAITQKNKAVLPGVSERLIAIRHANKIDYWILTQKRNTNKVYAFLVDDNGVSSSPVITSIGAVLNNPTGYLKPSPDGTKLASSQWTHNGFEIFDFNNANGALSNPVAIQGYPKVYGLEFSPDGGKLYIHCHENRNIYQFDLSKKTESKINKSAVYVGKSSGNYAGAMQLAPDNKIYVTKAEAWNMGVKYLGVIQFPNNNGVNCGFIDQAIDMETGFARLGLPNFARSYFSPSIQYDPRCLGDSTWFNITGIPMPDAVLWDFGDPDSGGDNSSTLVNPYHIYTATGLFTVSLDIYLNGELTTIQHQVTIHPSPEPWLGSDTAVCSNWPYVLFPDQVYASYLWQEGSTNPFFAVTQPGIYWVQVENQFGCTGTDSIQISFLPDPDITLGNDTLICYNNALILHAGTGFDSYLWQDGSQGQSLLVTQPGQYWVAVSNLCGSGSDTISVSFTDPYDISLGNDTSFCYGHSTVLDAGDGFDEYFWSTGAFGQTITATLGGTYWVQVTDTMGCTAMDSIYLDVYNDFE
ncbi:MAG: hypothetical protein EOM83_16440, partial [Clostridia bacterium]|nr:hypothetical protein [Clostridia bacterium]